MIWKDWKVTGRPRGKEVIRDAWTFHPKLHVAANSCTVSTVG